TGCGIDLAELTARHVLDVRRERLRCPTVEDPPRLLRPERCYHAAILSHYMGTVNLSRAPPTHPLQHRPHVLLEDRAGGAAGDEFGEDGVLAAELGEGLGAERLLLLLGEGGPPAVEGGFLLLLLLLAEGGFGLAEAGLLGGELALALAGPGGRRGPAL